MLMKDTGLSGPTVGTSINSDNMCFVAVDLAVLPPRSPPASTLALLKTSRK